MGCDGFGTHYQLRGDSGQLDGAPLPIDFAANLASLGAHTIRVENFDQLQAALEEARQQVQTTAIVVEVDREQRVPGYESWWDVAIPEISEVEAVQQARAEYMEAVKQERDFL